jgi:hypothetical protein
MVIKKRRGIFELPRPVGARHWRLVGAEICAKPYRPRDGHPAQLARSADVDGDGPRARGGDPAVAVRDEPAAQCACDAFASAHLYPAGNTRGAMIKAARCVVPSGPGLTRNFATVAPKTWYSFIRRSGRCLVVSPARRKAQQNPIRVCLARRRSTNTASIDAFRGMARQGMARQGMAR